MMEDRGEFVFLQAVPESYVDRDAGHVTGDDRVAVLVPVPDSRESDTGNVRVLVPAGEVFQARDTAGKPIPDVVNVRLPAGSDVEVAYADDSGQYAYAMRSTEQLVSDWKERRAEIARARSRDVFLNGVGVEMVRESSIVMKDGTGRRLKQVCVPDPESVPLPGKEQGYGSFFVHPDAVRPSGTGGKVDIRLGREDDAINGYAICAGIDGSGKGTYAKAGRTAGEVKSQYEAGDRAHSRRNAPAVTEERVAENGFEVGM